ncbi:MAG: hypothetical protein ABIV50_11340 [Opitutus sp.]
MTPDSRIAKQSRRPRAKSAGSLNPQAIFYAWFRLGLTSGLGNLWTTPTATLLSVLDNAIEQGIVPAPMRGARSSVRKEIERLKSGQTRRRGKRGPTRTAYLRDLLATLPLPLRPALRRIPVAAVARLRTDDQKLIGHIEEIAGFAGHGVAVARTLRLAAFTGGHLPLVSALQLRLKKVKESDGSLAPLTALQPDDWLQLVYTHGTPHEAKITPVAYADALTKRVEELYPHDALRMHFRQRRRLARLPALREVALFLHDNPGVDSLGGEPTTLLRDAPQRRRSKQRAEEFISGLRSLQRIFALTPVFDEISALLAEDLHSSAQLLAVGVHELARRLEGIISRERIAYLCRKAAFVLAGARPSQGRARA